MKKKIELEQKNKLENKKLKIEYQIFMLNMEELILISNLKMMILKNQRVIFHILGKNKKIKLR